MPMQTAHRVDEVRALKALDRRRCWLGCHSYAGRASVTTTATRCTSLLA
jgi:hypothetical protein